MAEPAQIAFRSLKTIGLLDASPVYEPVSGFSRPGANLRCSTYSPDGKYFAWASPEQILVVDPSVGHIVTTLPAPHVHELGFSPRGTYIITWQRSSKDEKGDAVKNLKVWRTINKSAGEGGEREVVGQFVQKNQTGWNPQYTSDEQFCARVVTNEVQFYQSEDLATVWNKLRVEGVTDFAVAPGEEHSVAVFVPERMGQPAAVKVFNVPQFDAPRSQKTFFKGDKVQLKWNDLGTSVIVLATTEVDKSNRSYYGESSMYILSANGGFDARIQLDKEGPIHDANWSPNSKEFGVVYGFMPAKTKIFNTKAEITHNFDLGPRNTILYSPQGRFVLVAGFGNLNGQCDIYDLEHDYAKICTFEASNSTLCEWSPDGKYILTATTSPRLRVENGFRIWHVGGGLVYHEEMDELYAVTWRPQSPDKRPIEDPLHPVPIPHSSALAYLGKVKTPSKPAGAYRPPGARGTSTPLHFKREDEGGAAYINNGISSAGSSGGVNGFGVRLRRREVPGAEVAESASLPPGAVPDGGVSLTLGTEVDEGLSKSAVKNKKKREAKKAKEAAEKTGVADGVAVDGEEGGSGGGGGGRPERKVQMDMHDRHAVREARLDVKSSPQKRDGSRQRRSKTSSGDATFSPGKRPPPPPPPPPPQIKSSPEVELEESPLSPGGGGSPHEKKVRALLKKLRAIDELKMRQAGGEALELSQISKIRNEEGVRRELEGLGVVV